MISSILSASSTLSAAIMLLLVVIAFLVKQIHTMKMNERRAGAEDRSASIKNSWNKLDELLTSLLVIHDIGTLNADDIKKEDFYQTVMDNACKLIRSTRGSLMIYDEKIKELRITASKNTSKEVIESTHIKPGQGIAGRAFQTGETIFITDPEHNTQYKDFIGKDEQKEPFIAVPLKVKDKTIGVLNLHLSREKGSFTDNDLKFLQLLAGEAAMTLENITRRPS